MHRQHHLGKQCIGHATACVLHIGQELSLMFHWVLGLVIVVVYGAAIFQVAFFGD